MDGTGLLFDELLPCLSTDTQAKVVSYPDHAYLSYQKLEELVVRQLPVRRKYIIMAESFSGPIALRVAHRLVGGGRLEAVVLVASFAYRPQGWMGFVLARLPLKMIFSMPLPNFVLRTLLLGESASPGIIKRTGEVIRQVAPAVLAGRLREALTSDYGKRRVDPALRVVAVFADGDRLLGREARRSIADVCEQAEVEIVDAPHFALQVRPRTVLEALLRLGILL